MLEGSDFKKMYIFERTQLVQSLNFLLMSDVMRLKSGDQVSDRGEHHGLLVP